MDLLKLKIDIINIDYLGGQNLCKSILQLILHFLAIPQIYSNFLVFEK